MSAEMSSHVYAVEELNEALGEAVDKLQRGIETLERLGDRVSDYLNRHFGYVIDQHWGNRRKPVAKYLTEPIELGFVGLTLETECFDSYLEVRIHEGALKSVRLCKLFLPRNVQEYVQAP